MTETTGSSQLIYNGRVIWSNPAALGHFAIKLRKQRRENQIVERMLLGRQEAYVRTAVLGGSRSEE